MIPNNQKLRHSRQKGNYNLAPGVRHNLILPAATFPASFQDAITLAGLPDTGVSGKPIK
jgi:hypothetical protein